MAGRATPSPPQARPPWNQTECVFHRSPQLWISRERAGIARSLRTGEHCQFAHDVVRCDDRDCATDGRSSLRIRDRKSTRVHMTASPWRRSSASRLPSVIATPYQDTEARFRPASDAPRARFRNAPKANAHRRATQYHLALRYQLFCKPQGRARVRRPAIRLRSGPVGPAATAEPALIGPLANPGGSVRSQGGFLCPAFGCSAMLTEKENRPASPYAARVTARVPPFWDPHGPL